MKTFSVIVILGLLCGLALYWFPSTRSKPFVAIRKDAVRNERSQTLSSPYSAKLWHQPEILPQDSASLEQPIELGQVQWQMDLEQAFAQSLRSGRPVLVLFQEVPG